MEQQQRDDEFNWGEEEEEEGEYETLNNEQPVGEKLVAATKTVEVEVNGKCSFKIQQVSLAADNASTQRHIVEMIFGPHME